MLCPAMVMLLVPVMPSAKDKKSDPGRFANWSVAVPALVSTSGPMTALEAVLTASQAIVITGVEAFSERPSCPQAPQPGPGSVPGAGRALDFERNDDPGSPDF
jgi:hypothetical protein